VGTGKYWAGFVQSPSRALQSSAVPYVGGRRCSAEGKLPMDGSSELLGPCNVAVLARDPFALLKALMDDNQQLPPRLETDSTPDSSSSR
jgi:hypothetical protein